MLSACCSLPSSSPLEGDSEEAGVKPVRTFALPFLDIANALFKICKMREGIDERQEHRVGSTEIGAQR
jgi:hypothetical protein